MPAPRRCNHATVYAVATIVSPELGHGTPSAIPRIVLQGVQRDHRATQLLTLVVAWTTTLLGGRRSDRPAPEETPGAPFAFKDSMIH